ncbi:hypothetical protein [Streptomyces sp. NPDC096323]|uniref:hypothetical protein n=1 Tax=Streptomyces sp. NPDC096323 TaxID=3155822 RepID=UPI003328D6CC
MPDSTAGDVMREVLHELVEQLGAPSQYAGGVDGPNVRWHAESHTVVLDAGRDGRLWLCARRTATLEAAESERFRTSAARGIQGGGEGLPYLWRYQRSASLPPSPTPVAESWAQLQNALETLLRAWSQHLEALVGDDDAGFTIDHGDGQLVLMVSPRDDVAVFADSRDGTDRNADQLSAMTARGWHDFLPVLSWWDAHFDRTPAGAASAAHLVVSELRARHVRTPSDLRLVRATLGTRGGRLDIPGSGIAAGAIQ